MSTTAHTQEPPPAPPLAQACPLTGWRRFCRLWLAPGSGRFILLGLMAGLCSGVAAILFHLGVEWLQHHLLVSLAGVALPAPTGERLFTSPPGPHRPWLIPVFTATVGLVTGFLVERLAPEATTTGTDGTDAMIKSFHREGGTISPWLAVIKGGGAILTIASGGSAGREGPISLIGAAVGSWLSVRLGLSERERRLLLLAGAAGGLGAIFRAPLGGALTAIEVLYREDFEAEAVLPSLLSSVVAYSLFALVFSTNPILATPDFTFSNPLELPFYAILAVACSAAGWAYLKTFFFFKRSIFASLRARLGLPLTTALGGLAMGLLGWAFPYVLSGGYGFIEMAVKSELTVPLMLAILAGKTVATALTIGSGMSGGMFAPSLFVGGMTGGVVGHLAHAASPHLVTQPGGYVLVGMAAFFSGVANAAIGPLVMVCEITQGYGLLAPLMLASALCIVLGRTLSLYENQVDTKFDSPAHLEDATINVLGSLQVRDHYRPGLVPSLEESTTLAALVDVIAGTSASAFPVRNSQGEITGIVSVKDVRHLLFESSLFDLVVAKELAKPPVLLHLHDDLHKALILFVDSDLGQIPVADETTPNRIIGQLGREDVFQAYSRVVSQTSRRMQKPVVEAHKS